MALVAQAATLVYIYARISRIAVNQTSFYATTERYAADEEKLSKVLQMLRTISRDNVRTSV